MAIVTMEIESYTVSATAITNSPSRFITLLQVAQAHGIRNRVNLQFSDFSEFGLGFVRNVDQPNFDGLNVLAFIVTQEFSEWYDILRNERPLQCYFSYEGDFDPNQPTRRLLYISLGTPQQEPPGEGPESFRRIPKDQLAALRRK